MSITLTGTFTRLDGDPATGTVKITPSRSPIMDSTGKVIISGPQVFPLDKDGKLTTEIPASNDPDLGPPFTYTVEALLSHRPWKISKVWIPHGPSTIDISTISDYTPLPGEPTRTVTIPADGEDGQVLVWDGAGFTWADQQIAPPVTAAELIAERLTFRSGDITVGIASDSTSNDPTDWVRLWEAHLAERYPHLRIENNQWNSATKEYGPTTVVQEGDGEPAFSGRVLHDTFTRTTDIADADEGGPWTVTSPENFILTGESAYTDSGGGDLIKDVGSRDFTSQTTLLVKTVGTANAQSVDIFHGGNINGVMIRLTITADGTAIAYIFNRVDATGAVLQSIGLATLPGWENNSDNWQTLHIEIQGDIQNYRATLSNGTGETTVTWALPEETYSAMPTTYSYCPYPNSAGIQVSEVALDVANRPSTYQTLRVWSGTMGGGTLQYQIDNWDAMFGDEEDTPGTEEITETRTLTDSFARTGTLAGSVTDTGQTWTGAAAWTTDGTRAIPDSSGSAYIKLDDITRASATVEAITTGPATTQTFRLGIRTKGDGVHGLFLAAAMTTGGAITATVYVRTPTAGFRPFPTMGEVELATGQATPQNLPLDIRLDGLTVTATAGETTGTWQITQAEANELGDRLELQAASPGVGSHMRVLDVQADSVHTTPAIPGEPATPLDVMIIGHGHNYGTRSGEEFIPILEGFLGHMRDRRPSTLPLLSSQNPQFPPTANPGPHADRQRAIRRYARQHQLAYAPVFEHFAAQPDSGRSWVMSDGVHPTGPATPTPTPGTGMSEWGRVLTDTVTD